MADLIVAEVEGVQVLQVVKILNLVYEILLEEPTYMYMYMYHQTHTQQGNQPRIP